MPARNITALLLLCALSGCASLHGSSLASEGIWQALNATDMAQSVTIAREPSRYTEGGMGTASIIGTHPRESSVEGFFAATALLHYAVSSWLSREADATGERGWYWTLYGWEVLTIVNSAYAVARNANAGVSLFGGHDPKGDGYFPYCTPGMSAPCVER